MAEEDDLEMRKQRVMNRAQELALQRQRVANTDWSNVGRAKANQQMLQNQYAQATQANNSSIASALQANADRVSANRKHQADMWKSQLDHNARIADAQSRVGVAQQQAQAQMHAENQKGERMKSLMKHLKQDDSQSGFGGRGW